MRTFQIIKKPLVTEKGTNAQQERNQYFFAVDPRATKCDVRQAVEKIFKVKVEDVRTMNVRGKLKRVGQNMGRLPAWKKACVTLKQGDRIEYLEGA